MSDLPELYDYNSEQFSKRVLINGRKYEIVRSDIEYKPVEYVYRWNGLHYQDPYDRLLFNLQLVRVPDVRITAKPKRTWASAMGLRRPTK